MFGEQTFAQLRTGLTCIHTKMCGRRDQRQQERERERERERGWVGG